MFAHPTTAVGMWIGRPPLGDKELVGRAPEATETSPKPLPHHVVNSSVADTPATKHEAAGRNAGGLVQGSNLARHGMLSGRLFMVTKIPSGSAGRLCRAIACL